MSRRELVERIVTLSYQKACRNPLFAHHLLKDPNSALGEILKEVTPGGSGGLPREEEEKVIAEAGEAIQLAPFLKREEMTKIVKDLIEYTASAFTITINHCRVLFWVGLALALGVAGLEGYAILGRIRVESALAGGLLGGGLGFGFIYTALVRRPLEEMQNSVGNLAQIQIIFLGFLDQVTILMANAESARLKDALKVISRIGSAVEEAASRIERYCEYRGDSSPQR